MKRLAEKVGEEDLTVDASRETLCFDVESDGTAAERNLRQKCRACLRRPCCRGCCCKTACPNPYQVFASVAAGLAMLLLLNLLCYSNSAAGPFKHSLHANHWAVSLLFLLACIVLWVIRERKRAEALPAAPILLYRKCMVFLIVYVLLIVFVYFVSRLGVYPGNFFDLGGGHESGSGVVFSFTSSYDGTALKGYRLRAGNMTSSQPALPVIFYGGNGQYMYGNVYEGLKFLKEVSSAVRC